MGISQRRSYLAPEERIMFGLSVGEIFVWGKAIAVVCSIAIISIGICLSIANTEEK